MKRLLLVEDDSGVAEATRFAPRSEWEVEHVRTLSDALAAAVRGQAGGAGQLLAVLYDLQLPDCGNEDGIELLLVADPRLAIVVYPGVVDEVLAERCRRAGAVDYVVEGGPVEELRMRLRFAVRRVTVPRAIYALGDLLMRWGDRTEPPRPEAAHGT